MNNMFGAGSVVWTDGDLSGDEDIFNNILTSSLFGHNSYLPIDEAYFDYNRRPLILVFNNDFENCRSQFVDFVNNSEWRTGKEVVDTHDFLGEYGIGKIRDFINNSIVDASAMKQKDIYQTINYALENNYTDIFISGVNSIPIHEDILSDKDNSKYKCLCSDHNTNKLLPATHSLNNAIYMLSKIRNQGFEGLVVIGNDTKFKFNNIFDFFTNQDTSWMNDTFENSIFINSDSDYCGDIKTGYMSVSGMPIFALSKHVAFKWNFFLSPAHGWVNQDSIEKINEKDWKGDSKYRFRENSFGNKGIAIGWGNRKWKKYFEKITNECSSEYSIKHMNVGWEITPINKLTITRKKDQSLIDYFKYISNLDAKYNNLSKGASKVMRVVHHKMARIKLKSEERNIDKTKILMTEELFMNFNEKLNKNDEEIVSMATYKRSLRELKKRGILKKTKICKKGEYIVGKSFGCLEATYISGLSKQNIFSNTTDAQLRQSFNEEIGGYQFNDREFTKYMDQYPNDKWNEILLG